MFREIIITQIIAKDDFDETVAKSEDIKEKQFVRPKKLYLRSEFQHTIST